VLCCSAFPSLQGPGVVVDLARRLTADDLTPCFGTVRSLGVLYRGDADRPGIAYTVSIVTDPKVDLVKQGCRAGKNKPNPVAS
jgi:hypothetical protein